MLPLLAQAAAPAAPAAGPLGNPLVFIVLMFAVFYFIVIRPQQRREKERKNQIASLRAGTKVIFAGGFIGTVEEVKDATFRIRVADGTVVEVLRNAVDRIVPEGGLDAKAAK